MKEIVAKRDFLKNLLEKQISSFENKKNSNLKNFIKHHRWVTILGALITILSGINIECFSNNICPNYITRFLILVLGAIITGLGAYKTFYNNRELWVKYTMTSNSLKEVKSDFEYYLNGKTDTEIDIKELDSFKNRIQGILNNTNKSWESVRNKKNNSY